MISLRVVAKQSNYRVFHRSLIPTGDLITEFPQLTDNCEKYRSLCCELYSFQFHLLKKCN